MSGYNNGRPRTVIIPPLESSWAEIPEMIVNTPLKPKEVKTKPEMNVAKLALSMTLVPRNRVKMINPASARSSIKTLLKIIFDRINALGLTRK